MPTTNTSDPNITLHDAIYSLRAIRRLKPDPISDDDLATILDAARQAPNGANRQNWHFVVIRDEQLRTKFGELYREGWWAKRKAGGFNKPEDLPEGHPLRYGAICWPAKLRPSTEKPSTESQDEGQPSPDSSSGDTGDDDTGARPHHPYTAES